MGSVFGRIQQQHRLITISRHNPEPQPYPNNSILTTKYTWYTFLPKSIILQFVRPANLVYLISAILQSIREISSLSPITAIAPFVFVIGISLIREGYEDYKRYQKDQEINQRITQKLNQNGDFVEVKWFQLKVADIVKVRNGEIIPADFLLLYSSQQNSMAFVETANLDGESNLKAKFAFNGEKLPNQKFDSIEGSILADAPNSSLQTFSGTITLQNQQQLPIDFSNFMLRQTSLKNTEQAIGLIIYTGHDTKILKNQGTPQNKVSNVQKKVNIIQGTLFIILLILSASCTIGFAFYHHIHHKRDSLVHLPAQVQNSKGEIALLFFSAFLLLTFLIPISLNVSIQVIKGFLGIFLSFDNKMYYPPIDKKCSANNVSIIEELGLIDYVLTDKTGTLTANEMVFKYLSLNDQCLSAEQLQDQVKTLSKQKYFHDFWICLLLCHDVLRDPIKGQYQGSSPDEVCFITFADKIGYKFLRRTKDLLTVSVLGKEISFDLLDVIPFDSRKCMSVIVRDLSSEKIYMFSKGADSTILPKSVTSQYDKNTKNNLTSFAKQGYRTLLSAQQKLQSSQYQAHKYKRSQLNLSKLKNRLPQQQILTLQSKLIQNIQSQLIILGATAIQDRLQQDVPLTIQRLQSAGIVVMMITGDKMETAENVGYLANFIQTEARVVRVQGGLDKNEVREIVGRAVEDLKVHSQLPTSLIIQGSAISQFLDEPTPSTLTLLSLASSIIFCRSSPKQKGKIVQFIKQKLNGITLAIGDGGNDVGMIQAANVGVGILGKQGNSASAASDFSIGQFKFLDRLVLHHGRWFYYRLSYFFVFFGWKNLIMTLLLYMFIVDSAFSAASGLSQPFITVYNIVIGLALVVYYTVFQQDINDDQLTPAFQLLPLFYKQTKSQDLFSYKRYLSWTIFAIILSVFMYISTRFGLGSLYAIDVRGYPGTYSHHTQALALALSWIVVMVICSDIRTWNWVIGVLVVGIITIVGTIAFFLAQSYIQLGTGTNYLILSQTSFRFWLVIFLNIGVVYAVKMMIDYFVHIQNMTQIDKAILKQNRKKKQQNRGQITPTFKSEVQLNQVDLKNAMRV